MKRYLIKNMIDNTYWSGNPLEPWIYDVASAMLFPLYEDVQLSIQAIPVTGYCTIVEVWIR